MPNLALLLSYLVVLVAKSGQPAKVQTAEPGTKVVHVRFAARINGVPFDCAKKFTGVGQTHATYEPQDFRMYVSRVHLLRAHGEVVQVNLTDDGIWQRQNVALLDFEDATGHCQNGTPQVHTELMGTVPAYDDYTGITFAMAVPFELDHQDASAALPPFDQAGLFWGWQAGYKFLTLDGRVDEAHGHSVHIASTGCEMDVPSHVQACRAPNEATVILPNFRADSHIIVADIGHLLADSTLQPMPKPHVPGGKPSSHVAFTNGCMSEPYNTRCQPIFVNLGLPFQGQMAQPVKQRFFAVE